KKRGAAIKNPPAAEDDEPQRLLPLAADDVEEQQRADRDRAGDRHPVRVGQRGRGAERENEREHRDAQPPVDPGDVDLPDPFLRGGVDAQPRQVPDLGGLLRHGKRAGDDRLGGDDGRGGGQDHHGDPRPAGRQQEEGIADRGGGIGQDKGALSQVVEDAGGEDKEDPRPRDRAAAEVPHVGVERLGAGHREHHRRQREERRAEMPEEEGGRVGGGQRLEYRRVADDAADAPGGDYREPDGHHRPEQPPDRARPEPLDHEEADEDHRGDREHDGTNGRRRDLHALDRGEHGNRRGDHAVAEEQRGAEYAEQGEHHGRPPPAWRVAADQGD